MTRHLILLSLILIFLSCQAHQKFDKEKWAEVTDLMAFPNRKYLVDDLLKNYQLKDKKFNDIVELLGEPQSKLDSNMQVIYNIDVDYSSDIDPIYTKILSISFYRDTVVKSFEVLEWKK